MTQFAPDSAIVGEWKPHYADITELTEICSKLVELDAGAKSALKTSGGDQVANGKIQEIKGLSQTFLNALQTETNKVDAFFMKQIGVLKKELENVCGMAQSALQNKIQPSKCRVIGVRMAETMQRIHRIQSFGLHNYEELRKISELHDKASTFNYNAKRYFEDKMLVTTFDDDDSVVELEDQLVAAYAELFAVSTLEAKAQLTNQGAKNMKSSSEKLRRKMQTQAAIFGSLAAAAVLQLISLCVYCFETTIGFKITKIQEMAIRIHFVIATMFVGIGCVIWACHQFNINYSYIFQLPEGVIQTGFRNILRLGSIQLLIVALASIMCIAGQIQLFQPESVLPVAFGNYVVKISRVVRPTYWLLVPTVVLPVYFLVNCVRFRGKSSLSRYSMVLLFKMFTPWRQKVQFSHFFFCNYMNSSKDSFKEIIQVMGCDRVPEYITILFQNLFNYNRALQSYIRFRENNIFYSQGYNMIKYLISMCSSLSSMKAIKDVPGAYWTFIGFKALETLYKFYWDACEDWGLLMGGSSGKKYRGKRDKWQYGHYCKRPSNVPLWLMIAIHVYDYSARLIWIFGMIEDYKDSTKLYWYKTLTVEIEVVRRLCWMVLRLDNQQATNVEGYAATNVIPVPVDEYQRDAQEQIQQQNADAQEFKQLQDLITQFKQSVRTDILDTATSGMADLQRLLQESGGNGLLEQLRSANLTQDESVVEEKPQAGAHAKKEDQGSSQEQKLVVAAADAQPEEAGDNPFAMLGGKIQANLDQLFGGEPEGEEEKKPEEENPFGFGPIDLSRFGDQ